MKPFSRLSCKIGVFSCSRSNCSNSSPAPKIHPRQNGRAVGISIIGFAQLSRTVLLSTCIQYSIILYNTILYYMVSTHLNDKTKLPTDVERALVEIGGADLNATLTRHELSEALVKAIDFIGGHNPDLLRTIFRKVVGVESVDNNTIRCNFILYQVILRRSDDCSDRWRKGRYW